MQVLDIFTHNRGRRHSTHAKKHPRIAGASFSSSFSPTTSPSRRLEHRRTCQTRGDQYHERYGRQHVLWVLHLTERPCAPQIGCQSLLHSSPSDRILDIRKASLFSSSQMCIATRMTSSPRTTPSTVFTAAETLPASYTRRMRRACATLGRAW